MKLLVCSLFLPVFLGAQAPNIVPQSAPKPADPGTVKVAEKAKLPEKAGQARSARRAEELGKREAHADQLAKEARRQKLQAAQEKARQSAYKRAEADALRKADRAKRQGEGFQKQAEALRKRAEEIRRKAEDSWKTYQAASRPTEAAKAKPAVKPAETPKVETPKPETSDKQG